MLVGLEYDKIEFQLFGLNLLEPNGVIGDIVIFAISLFFAYKIKKMAISTPFFNLWRWFFIVFGIGFLVGGFGHLFFNYYGVPGKYGAWYLGILSNIFLERAMVSIHPSERFRRIANLITLIKLVLSLTGLTWSISYFDLNADPAKGMWFPMFSSVVGVLFCHVYLGIVYAKRISPVFRYLWISFIVTVPSVIILSLKISPAQWYDKNDLAHSFMILGMFFYFFTVWGYSKELKQNL
ncbi:MAG: hypothetical protein QNL61_00840 [Crocinitomicaceae bacterium]